MAGFLLLTCFELLFSAYKVGPHRLAVLGLGLIGRPIGSMELEDDSCGISVRLSCTEGSSGLDGKLTPMLLDVDKVQQSTVRGTAVQCNEYSTTPCGTVQCTHQVHLCCSLLPAMRYSMVLA